MKRKRNIKLQEEENKRWKLKHKWNARCISYRSTAKTFIRHYASRTDLRTLRKMCNKKLKKADKD